jgi:hypothetical protein
MASKCNVSSAVTVHCGSMLEVALARPNPALHPVRTRRPQSFLVITVDPGTDSSGINCSDDIVQRVIALVVSD